MFDYVGDARFVAFRNSIGLQFDYSCRMNLEMKILKVSYRSVCSNGGGVSILHEISYVKLLALLTLIP
jgi:hypothetical protein